MNDSPGLVRCSVTSPMYWSTMPLPYGGNKPSPKLREAPYKEHIPQRWQHLQAHSSLDSASAAAPLVTRTEKHEDGSHKRHKYNKFIRSACQDHILQLISTHAHTCSSSTKHIQLDCRFNKLNWTDVYVYEFQWCAFGIHVHENIHINTNTKVTFWPVMLFQYSKLSLLYIIWNLAYVTL